MSPDMEPYLRLCDGDRYPEFDEVARLPLEKRYIWRVASALKWGLLISTM
jgi:hypothetical protein